MEEDQALMIPATYLPGEGGRITRWGQGVAPVLPGEEATEVPVGLDPSRQWAMVEGQLTPYQPPAPADTEWATYSWSAQAWAWVATPTTAALALAARAERDRRMDATVSVSLKYYRLGEPIPQAWADYMQALADVPEQPGFPTAITWPTPPTP